MESIKTNLDAHQLTLAQSQEKGISVTGRGASSSYFEDLGSTNYVMESKDARNGKGSKKQGAVRNNSNVLLSDASSSEADDELNIHENSSLPGTPVVPVGKLSTYGLPYHENYPPKKLPSFKKKKKDSAPNRGSSPKPENDENSPSVIMAISPKKATRLRRRNASPTRPPLKSTSSGLSKPRPARRKADSSEGAASSRESQASSFSSPQTVPSSSSVASGSGSKLEDPISAMMKQKEVENEDENSHGKNGSTSSRRPSKRSNNAGSTLKKSLAFSTSSCPIDDLVKDGLSSPSSQEKRKKKASVAEGIDEADRDVHEGSSKARVKRKEKASPSEPKSSKFTPFPLQRSPQHKKTSSTSSSVFDLEPKPSEREPFPLERSPQQKNISSVNPSFLTLVGGSDSGRGKIPEQEPPNASRKLNPFPLSLPSSSQHSAKRSSDEELLDSSPVKRMRSSGLDEFEDYSLGDDFSFTQDVKADPKTICPFCDLHFPSDPSPLLEQMLRRARSRAYRDPRPANKLGLKADMTVYIDMCQRHRFEVEQLPKAAAHGWPTKINFDRLPERVEALRTSLDMVINDKERSVFWKELKRNIDKDGLMKTVGLAGQMNAFQNCQPGYYGELGSMIIYQTLYNMFPLETLSIEKIAPLPVTDFIQRILVPEAGVALVRDDMGVDEDNALKTLRESSSYGAAMFPVTDKDGVEEVHDKLVKERARAKRREIEEMEGSQGPSGGGSSSKQRRRKVNAVPKQRKQTTKPARWKNGPVDVDVVDVSDSTMESDTTCQSSRTTRAAKKAGSDPRSSSPTSQASESKANASFTASLANMATPRPRPRPRPRQPAQTEGGTSLMPPWSSSQETKVKSPGRVDRGGGALDGKSHPLAMAKSRAQTAIGATAMSTASSHSWHTNMRDTASDSDSESELKTVVGTSDPGVKNLSKEKDKKSEGYKWLFSSQESGA